MPTLARRGRRSGAALEQLDWALSGKRVAEVAVAIAQRELTPGPSLRTGVLSTSELATLWQLPRGRVKHAALLRSTVRRAIAPAGIDREPSRVLMRDEHGAVSIAPADRKFGHALIGGQGGGKSSVLARHFANDARDPDRAVILIDPKGRLAELCLGLVPAWRTVQPGTQQARAAHLHARDRHAAASPRDARPRRDSGTGRDPDRGRREGRCG